MAKVMKMAAKRRDEDVATGKSKAERTEGLTKAVCLEHVLGRFFARTTKLSRSCHLRKQRRQMALKSRRDPGGEIHRLAGFMRTTFGLRATSTFSDDHRVLFEAFLNIARRMSAGYSERSSSPRPWWRSPHGCWWLTVHSTHQKDKRKEELRQEATFMSTRRLWMEPRTRS